MLSTLPKPVALPGPCLLAAHANQASSIEPEGAPTVVVFNATPEVSHFDLGDSDRPQGELTSWHAGLALGEGREATRNGHCKGARPSPASGSARTGGSTG